MISKHDLFLLVIYVDNLPLKYLQRVAKILKLIYGQYAWENIFARNYNTKYTLVKELYLLVQGNLFYLFTLVLSILYLSDL